MRIRNRTIIYDSCPATAGATVKHYDMPCGGAETPSDEYVGGSPYIVVSQLRERIDDETGPRSPHPVSHWKYTCDGHSADPSIYWTPSPYYVGNTRWEGANGFTHNTKYLAALRNSTNVWTIPESGVVPTPPYYSFDTGSVNEVSLRNSVRSKATGLRTDILQDIIEANQVWPSIRSLAGGLPYLRKTWPTIRKALSYAAKHEKKNIGRRLSGAYLAEKFGLKPIFDDFYAVRDYLPRMSADIQRYRDQDIQRYTAKAVMVVNGTVRDTEYSFSGLGKEIQKNNYSVLFEPTVRYVLNVRPRVTFDTPFFQKVDALARAFGPGPATEAWELIPYSFVVDWFVDMRGTCSFLDQCCGFAPYTIESFTRSFKYQLRTAFTTYRTNSCTGAVISGQSGEPIINEYKHYERSLVDKTDILPIFVNRFGKNQAAISAALITQALSKR